MRPILALFAPLLPLFLSGCYVQSLHPFYMEETRIEYREIEGQWQPVDDDEGETPWTFEKNTILTYQDDVPSEIEVRYFEVDGLLFADWTAGDLDDEAPPNLFWATHVVPTHSVFRVDLDEQTLALTPLDIDWLDKALKAGVLSLSHVMVDDDRRVFTVSPEIWTRFLIEYGDDSEAFDPDDTYHFRWPVEPLETEPAQTDSFSIGAAGAVIAAVSVSAAGN